MLTNIPRLITAYYSEHPDTTDPTQRVRFGTSGHRGTSLNGSFNEPHVLAITQAICLYRRAHQIDGPLFLGWDTHALSEPARVSALEVLAADHVDVMADVNDAATPTPVVSQAIVAYNRGRTSGLADGIVITPSHNPPDNGGIKYDPPTGGPAQSAITDWIEGAANQLLEVGMHDVKRIPWARARHEPTLHRFDYQQPYVDALPRVIDMDAVRDSGLHIGVDPLGGASLRYWDAISERFKLRVTVVNRMVDPTFRFVPVDHDGVIRMDPSSRYAMARLVDARQQFDLAFANDPDADRYGIVSRTIGLIDPNHALAAAVWYLGRHRPQWPAGAAVGRTIVTSSLIDRVAVKLGRPVFETPVGFKYFVDRFLDGSLAVAGEESAGASLLCRDGSTWTTDKDGLVMGLLAAESTSRTGREPGEQYADIEAGFGPSFSARIDLPVRPGQRDAVAQMTTRTHDLNALAGASIVEVATLAAGNQQPFGGIKVVTKDGWFAVRPSGTEALLKVYAESFIGTAHLEQLRGQAVAFVDTVRAAD